MSWVRATFGAVAASDPKVTDRVKRGGVDSVVVGPITFGCV